MVEKEQYVFKICVLGEPGTGKTSLIDRYCERRFSTDYKPTLGASIIAKDVAFDNVEVRLVLWDIAGQEKYNQVRNMYLNGAQGAILVYDITRRPTFEEIKNRWIADFRQYAQKDAKYILIGNKLDLFEKRNVSIEDGKALANELKTDIFLETSARTGENVLKAFEELVRDIVASVPKE